MRRRLVAALVGLACAVIAVFGIQRGYVAAQLVESEHRASLDRSAEVAAFMVAEAVRSGDPVTVDLLAAAVDDGESCEYAATGQPPVVAPAGEADTADGDLTTQRVVADGGTVTVHFPGDKLRDEVVRELTPIVVVALLLVALSVLAGWLMARRLSRPFGELANVAVKLRRGHLDAAVPPPYDIPEADAIARAMEDSAEKLRNLVRAERDRDDNASHDLRTPITALRLALEDLSHWPTTTPEVSAELTRMVGEVDRFSDVVSTMVDIPTAEGSVALVDMVDLVRNALQDRECYDGSPAVRVEADHPVLARLQVALARQTIALLVEHAAAGAGGDVAVAVQGRQGYVRIELRGATRSESIVWDQAAGMAVRLGGRLTSPERADGEQTWLLVLPEEPRRPRS